MERFKITKRVSTLGILGNILLLIIKAIVGVASKSQAMIADAANSAGDIFASAMTAIGNKIASEPKDETHNFGHGKAEYIFSLFISMTMIALAFKILIDSIVSIVYGNTIEFSWWLILVCCITIVVKLALYLYSKNALEKYKNILLESNMKDHRNDCIITLFTTFSIILTKFGVNWFDGVTGVGISIWIFYTGARIFVESYNILMDSSLDSRTTNDICEYIKKIEEVKGIESIHSIPTGYKYIVVITIFVSGDLDTFESHKIADSIQEEIETNFEEIDKAIIHVEPFKE